MKLSEKDEAFRKNNLNPFIGQPTTFHKANPTVKSLRIDTKEFKDGKEIKSWLITDYTFKRIINCANGCDDGLNIQDILTFNVFWDKKTFYEGVYFCRGKFTSPKGRKIYDTCYGCKFEYSIIVEYKKEE